MAIKKSEIYSKLWASCDELRGSMDPSQYKDYILVLLFIKYVSDRYAGKKDAPIDVPKGGGFSDLIELKEKKDIGDKINIAIKKLAQANDLVGVIDVADFNNPDKLGDSKQMVSTLSKLIGIFQDLNLKSNKAEDDDLLGDAYEYLMRHFATESG
jgi:type I restriction enzyme M protein